MSGKDQYIAEALSALGDAHHRFDGDKVAEKYLEEAYRYSEKLTVDVDRRIIVECGWSLADVKYCLGHPVQSIISFILNLQSDFGATMGDYQRADIKSLLGLFLARACRYSEALSTLLKAIEMFKRIKNFLDAALSMVYIAQVYRNTSRLAEALKTITEANDILEHFDHRAICSGSWVCSWIDITYGNILVDLCQYTEAISKFEKALSFDQHRGRILGVACNLENLGYVYVCRGDYEDASAAYVAAIKKYGELGQEAYKLYIRRCRRNLDFIRWRIDDETMDISIFIERLLNESGAQAIGRASIRVKLDFSLPILGQIFLFAFLLLKLWNTELQFKLFLLLVFFLILQIWARK